MVSVGTLLGKAAAYIPGLASGLSDVLAGVPAAPGRSGFFAIGPPVPRLAWLLAGVPCVESVLTGTAGLAGFFADVSDFTSGGLAAELVFDVVSDFG